MMSLSRDCSAAAVMLLMLVGIPAEQTLAQIPEVAPILTPKPGPAPRINGPRVLGARPGKPFLYRIPCTGRRPIEYSVEGLPGNLTLDSAKGVINGRVPKETGDVLLTVRARNQYGEAERGLKISVGDTLALTPPMGWNHWYAWYHRISAAKMKQAADQMIASGMADAGYSYVNIDDCWMKMPPHGYRDRRERLTGLDVEAVVGETRDAEGRVLSNEHFPDMKGLADYIHSLGLRAGLYTSPGPLTCQKYEGSYEHERLDAEQYAEWGYDFLKYDWCSYETVADGEGPERLQKPYLKMSAILKTLDRDIVFNLCQYGMGNVWEWGGEVGGHCWRTTGDLGLEKGDRLPGFYHIAFSNLKHWEYARPGQWNDPDYLLIGWVGVPPSIGSQLPQPTKLTAHEQYSYMSLWCLMAAPLFFSGDMERLDKFTLNVLCNPEVIDIDQDPLGKQARPILHNEEVLILAKPLEDGSVAVGLFNLAETERRVSVSWERIGLNGPQRVRDLWRHKDLGMADGTFGARIDRHGVKLVRLWAKGDE